MFFPAFWNLQKKRLRVVYFCEIYINMLITYSSQVIYKLFWMFLVICFQTELYRFLCLFIFWADSLHLGVKQMFLEQMTDCNSHRKGILKEYFPFLVNYIPRTIKCFASADEITASVEEGSSVDVIYLDVSKAFHTVSWASLQSNYRCGFDRKTKNDVWKADCTS